MSERYENLGRRLEFRREKARLTAEVGALRDKLRRELPVVEEEESLDGEAILNAALALGKSLEELRAVASKLAVLDRELGA